MRPQDSDQDRVERFRAIYLKNYVSILGYTLRRTSSQDDAADVVVDRAPIADEIRPWLYGIARNVLANGYRSERRWAHLTARLRTETIAKETGDAGLASEVVSRAMQQLSPADRELLRLAAWEDLTPGEMAATLGCSVSAAKTRLHRARRHLAQKLVPLADPMHQRARTEHIITELPGTTGKEEAR